MEGGILETQNSMPMKTQYKHAISTSAFNCIWTSLFLKQKEPWGECFMFHCVFISFHHSIWKRHPSQWCQRLASFLLAQLLRSSSPQLILTIHEYSPASRYKHSRAAFSFGDLEFFKQNSLLYITVLQSSALQKAQSHTAGCSKSEAKGWASKVLFSCFIFIF